MHLSTNQGKSISDASNNHAPDSMASNYLSASVNSRTGELNVSIKSPILKGILSMNINLGVSYNQSDAFSFNSIMGLPSGWSYRLSYIDFSSNQIRIKGAESYLLDQSSPSGLRYYKLKNVCLKFCGASDCPVLPYDKQQAYAYLLKFYNGNNEYFDEYGRLIAMDDKNGNNLLFYYDKASQGVYTSKLNRIVDSYGQIIHLQYKEDEIQIKYPKGGVNSIQFSYVTSLGNTQLTKYIDPLGQITKIEYNGGVVRTGLISKIKHPNQLIKSYNYSSIYYLSSDKNQLQQDVIDSVISESQGVKRITKYSFISDGDNHNYLGFPKYITNPREDALLESNDSAYLYSSSINNGVTIIVRTYNHLHLMLKKQILTLEEKNISDYSYTYSGQVGENSFPPFNELPSNYQSTTKIISKFYNDNGQHRAYKTETSYNDFAQIISIKNYERTNNSEDYMLNSATKSEYSSVFGVLLKKESFDYKPNGIPVDKPFLRQRVNLLTTDQKQVKTSQLGRLKLVDNNDVFLAEKVSDFLYDKEGRVISKTLSWASSAQNKIGPSSINYTITYKHEPNEHLIVVTKKDCEGNLSFKFIDSCTGFLIKKTNALNASVHYTYDSLGRKLIRKDPLGILTKWSYDDVASKVTKELANGFLTYTYYNSFGNEIKRCDNLGVNGTERILQVKSYDLFGRLISEQGILGGKSEVIYKYNTRGLVASKSDSLGNVLSYEYDAVQRTRTSFFNTIKTKEEAYDAYRKITSAIKYSSSGDDFDSEKSNLYNGENLKVFTLSGKEFSEDNWTIKKAEFDLSNKFVSVENSGWDNVQKTENYVRDLFDKISQNTSALKEYEQPENHATSSVLKHNSIGLLQEEISPTNLTKSYKYDSVGNNVQRTNFDGNIINYSYYANRNLKRKSFYDANNDLEQISYTYYEGTKLIKSISNSKNETITYAFELDGKLSSIEYPDKKKLLWTYDNVHNRLDYFIGVNGDKTQYTYDDYGRVIKIDSGGFSVAMTYFNKLSDRSNSGRLKTIKYSNGMLVNLTYNGYNLTKNMLVTNTQNEKLLEVSYEYDKTSKSIISNTYSSLETTNLNTNYISKYSYNSIGKLIKESVIDLKGKPIKITSYSYDAASNIIAKNVTTQSSSKTTNYVYDDDNKLLTIKIDNQVYTLMYDINGNMTNDGFGNTYKYNRLNQLIGFIDKEGTQSHYAYYPNGLRKSKQVDDQAAVYFYYDHNKNPNIVNEVQDNLATSYVMLGSVRFVRIVNDSVNIVPEYMIHDQKNVLLIVDRNDKYEAVYNYEPYGESRSFTSSLELSETYIIKNNPFKFTQEYEDTESGLYYLRSRYYNPRIMRFINRDSIHIFNHYNYANGNPVMMTDKSGHMAWWSWLITGLTFLATAIATIATFGAAAPAAAAADAADLGGLAAEAGVSALETGSSAVEGSAEGVVSGVSEETVSDVGDNILEGGFDPEAQTLPTNNVNPNGLNNNCFFCATGQLLGRTAPEVADALGVPEGLVNVDNMPEIAARLGIIDDAQTDTFTTTNSAEAFDFMAQEPSGTRFVFGYRTGAAMTHWLSAESDGLGNAVDLFDPQYGIPRFGDPTSPNFEGAERYWVIRDRVIPMDLSE